MGRAGDEKNYSTVSLYIVLTHAGHRHENSRHAHLCNGRLCGSLGLSESIIIGIKHRDTVGNLPLPHHRDVDAVTSSHGTEWHKSTNQRWSVLEKKMSMTLQYDGFIIRVSPQDSKPTE